MFAFLSVILSSLRNLPRFDAGGANLHALGATLRQGDANRLQIRIEPAWRAVIGVGNIIAELRAFSTDFATFSHI